MGSILALRLSTARSSRASNESGPPPCSVMAWVESVYPPGCKRTSFWRQTTTIWNWTSIAPVGLGTMGGGAMLNGLLVSEESSG